MSAMVLVLAVGISGGVNTVLVRGVSGAAETVPDLNWKQSAVLGFGTAAVGLLVGLAIQAIASPRALPR
jgi:hypothetical protein